MNTYKVVTEMPEHRKITIIETTIIDAANKKDAVARVLAMNIKGSLLVSARKMEGGRV